MPEGSYATDPEGAARTVQFRQMVQALNDAGLRVVMDVVYNHTAASGEAADNVLDQIVPGYYQRLTPNGAVDHLDLLRRHRARERDDGQARRRLGGHLGQAVQGRRLPLRPDGLPPQGRTCSPSAERARRPHRRPRTASTGRRSILYGEGWNFGEVANNARFVQATQANMAGTGIATFYDRPATRSAAAARSTPTPRMQGFASGLFTDPNGAAANGTRPSRGRGCCTTRT